MKPKKKKKKSSVSPTQISLKFIRKYYPDALYAIVEHWNPWARKRKDLFNIGDILFIWHGTTFLIQCTTRDNMSARVKKIRANAKALGYLRDARWVIQVWGTGNRIGNMHVTNIKIHDIATGDEVVEAL